MILSGISGISHPRFRHLLSHKIILLNFISCDISLLFTDTEIFAAYAGSCLLEYQVLGRKISVDKKIM